MGTPDGSAGALLPPPSGQVRQRLGLRAWGIAGAYAIVATLWIYFSDQALSALISDRALLIEWSVYKGVAFVAVTSLLLLFLIRGAFSTIEAGYASLKVRDEERRMHLAEIERLSRLYAALSQVNQAIVRLPSRDELFARVCQALVDFGRFRVAWIGWHDPESGQILPVGRWGDDDGYLESVTIYVDDRPEGRGPSGIAFRSRQPYICNDIFSDPATVPWREEARRRGFSASGAFPIRMKGEVVGLLNVYAVERDYFHDKEIALLTEAAADVSFALDNLAREEAREEANALAEKEKHFSDTIIESMPGILYLYSAEGQFLRWNRNFEVVSGHSAQELARAHPLDFFGGGDKELVGARIAEVFAEGESSIEASFVAKDGTEVPYFFTGRHVAFEGYDCLVGVGIDISQRTRAETELRSAEQALRGLNQTLEEKVANRTEELQAALVRAEAADQLKSAFLATMSHELRTPLNSIIGFTGTVLQELAGPLTDEQAKQLRMVQLSARHLLDLITDVLDLSRIEAGQLEVHSEPFDLGELIEQVTATVRPQADAKGLTLSVDIGEEVGVVTSDRRRLGQVLLNLVNNGIKFTDEGGVTLRAERDAERVRLRVTDTGIGIRPEDLTLLFQPFHQLDTGLTRQHEGTGLGLAICRRLMGLMGGEISATSDWQSGSEFSVTLPTPQEG